MNDLSRLLRYARPYAGALALGILLTSVVGLFEAARMAMVAPIVNGLTNTSHDTQLPYLPRLIVDNIALPWQADLWTTIALLLVLFTIMKGIAYFFSGYLLTGVGQQIIVKL